MTSLAGAGVKAVGLPAAGGVAFWDMPWQARLVLGLGLLLLGAGFLLVRAVCYFRLCRLGETALEKAPGSRAPDVVAEITGCAEDGLGRRERS